ncbi:MAG TPA: YibE/F family protein, partial [Microlunatus sp.]|nr:YibE/F family protein [Microlunatus sp.]
WRGFAALLGLAFAGFIMVKFMFPALVVGTNPIAVGLIGSSAIMFVALYAAHGFSARTTTALLGTLSGLVLVAGLGWLATKWGHLTGVSAEDDYILAAAAPDLQLTSVVICGIIVAGLGVLNDVTITQASAVWELADTDPDQRRLFSRAMRIGRDHIASTVYTIAFATAGAVLPVLLLIAIYDRPLLQVVQSEQFASEVIRTLVGSIGLVLAVPLTTAIGVAVVRVSRNGRPAVVGAAASPTTPTGALTRSGVLATLGRLRHPFGRRGAEPAAAATAPAPDVEHDDANAAADTAEESQTTVPIIEEADGPGSDRAGSDEDSSRDGAAGGPAGAAEPPTPSATRSEPGDDRHRFRFRRRPRPEDDDIDDFSDLRDPVDGPESPGRR